MEWTAIGVIVSIVMAVGNVCGAVFKYGRLDERVTGLNEKIDKHEAWCGRRHDEELANSADDKKWREEVIDRLARIEANGNGKPVAKGKRR